MNAADWPFWAQAMRIGITLAFTLLCGMHAWAQFRRGEARSSYLRWVYFLYAAAFMFVTWANFVMMMVTIYAHDYRPGPYHLATLSLLLTIAYIFTAMLRIGRSTN